MKNWDCDHHHWGLIVIIDRSLGGRKWWWTKCLTIPRLSPPPFKKILPSCLLLRDRWLDHRGDFPRPILLPWIGDHNMFLFFLIFWSRFSSLLATGWQRRKISTGTRWHFFWRKFEKLSFWLKVYKSSTREDYCMFFNNDQRWVMSNCDNLQSTSMWDFFLLENEVG